jgi:hypothetical protein
MSVNRARAACPKCNVEEEVWFYYSNISPASLIECTNCFVVYDPADYIISLLELRQNVTVSSTQLVFS